MSPYLALIKLRLMGSNGTPKPDEREYPDEEIESYYYYAVSENDELEQKVKIALTEEEFQDINLKLDDFES